MGLSRPALLGIVAGGALGGLLRVAAEAVTGGAVAAWLTLVAVNVIGSFLIGVLYGRAAGPLSPVVSTGVLGGFTSFSGWALDVVWLWGARPAVALAVGLAVPLACVGACLAGLLAGSPAEGGSR